VMITICALPCHPPALLSFFSPPFDSTGALRAGSPLSFSFSFSPLTRRRSRRHKPRLASYALEIGTLLPPSLLAARHNCSSFFPFFSSFDREMPHGGFLGSGHALRGTASYPFPCIDKTFFSFQEETAPNQNYFTPLLHGLLREEGVFFSPSPLPFL